MQINLPVLVLASQWPQRGPFSLQWFLNLGIPRRWAADRASRGRSTERSRPAHRACSHRADADHAVL